MNIFRKLFGGAKSSAEQAVLVYLDGTGLPASVYEEYDLATLEDQLTEVLARERTGEFDGNEIGPGATTLFMYGPDAERLFQTVEPVLCAYPLCQGARVVVRAGQPGAAEREVKLGSGGPTLR